MKRFVKWWYFHFANPVIRKGETKSGGFRWKFRRFWLDIETFSGNFKCRFTADEHPYAYLLAGKDDENIAGFCEIIYYVSKLVTAERSVADGVVKILNDYINSANFDKEDREEEDAALEEMKAVQKYVDAPKKEKRKMERDVNGRFKATVKAIENEE